MRLSILALKWKELIQFLRGENVTTQSVLLEILFNAVTCARKAWRALIPFNGEVISRLTIENDDKALWAPPVRYCSSAQFENNREKGAPAGGHWPRSYHLNPPLQIQESTPHPLV